MAPTISVNLNLLAVLLESSGTDPPADDKELKDIKIQKEQLKFRQKREEGGAVAT